MKIKTEHVESDPTGDAGSFTTFNFCANGEKMFGRRCDSDMKTADLIHWRDKNKKFHIFEKEIPYHLDLFRQAVRYYIDSLDIKNVFVLVFPEGKKGHRRPKMKRVDLRKFQKNKK